MRQILSGIQGLIKATAIQPDQKHINRLINIFTLLMAVVALTPSSSLAGQTGKKMLSTGIVTEKHSAVISAKLSSYVAKVCCDVGDEVEKGSTLIRLDSAEFEANAAMAKAKLDGATAHSQNVRLSYERTKELLSRGSTTQSSFDRTKAEFDKAMAAKAMAKAALDKANIFLLYTKLTSPISGVVDYKKIDEGELTAPGQALMRVVDTKNLWFETSVKESDINEVKIGQKVLVNIDSMKGEGIKGVVASVAPTGSRSSHSFNVRIDLPRTDGLKIGMYGKVNWEISTAGSGGRRGK